MSNQLCVCHTITVKIKWTTINQSIGLLQDGFAARYDISVHQHKCLLHSCFCICTEHRIMDQLTPALHVRETDWLVGWLISWSVEYWMDQSRSLIVPFSQIVSPSINQSAVPNQAHHNDHMIRSKPIFHTNVDSAFDRSWMYSSHQTEWLIDDCQSYWVVLCRPSNTMIIIPIQAIKQLDQSYFDKQITICSLINGPILQMFNQRSFNPSFHIPFNQSTYSYLTVEQLTCQSNPSHGKPNVPWYIQIKVDFYFNFYYSTVYVQYICHNVCSLHTVRSRT